MKVLGSLGAVALGMLCFAQSAAAHGTYHKIDCSWGEDPKPAALSEGRQFDADRPDGMVDAAIWGQWPQDKGGTWYSGPDHIEMFTHRFRGFLGRPQHGADNVDFTVVTFAGPFPAELVQGKTPAELSRDMYLEQCIVRREDH